MAENKFELSQQEIKEITKIFEEYKEHRDDDLLIEQLKKYTASDGTWSLMIRWWFDVLGI